MTLRIGASSWDRTGDNSAARPGHQPPRAQPGARGGHLSTLAVHEIAPLTCTDVAIPRIHHAYYDYHLSIYRDPKNQVAAHQASRQADGSKGRLTEARAANPRAG